MRARFRIIEKMLSTGKVFLGWGQFLPVTQLFILDSHL